MNRIHDIRRKALESALRETLSSFRRDELEIEPMADPLDAVRWSMERDIAGRALRDPRRPRARRATRSRHGSRGS